MASWDEVVAASRIDSEEEDDIFGITDFKQLSTNEKLDLLMVALNKMNKAALVFKVADLNASPNSTKTALVDQVEFNSEKIQELEHIVSSLHDDNQFTRGVFQKQDKQITSLQNTVTNLMAKSMEDQIIVTGLEGGKISKSR